MAIESMYVFTGDEVVATDLPAKLNENFAKTETNMLKTVNNVAQDENHNINVTELIPKQITSNTNLNNLVTSGEYTFTKGSATITNSPTSNSFFLTVLRNDALVKQVVTEVAYEPITYTRVLSGSSWSPWVEGGKVKTINSIEPDDNGNVDLGIIPIAKGGTGASTAEQARTNFGIKDIATYDVLPIANGGTGATTAKQARTNLEVEPIGTIFAFAGNNIPAGYLPCNGSAISRTTYVDLFTVIGTTYGSGNGSTTFSLPNLTDKFIQGSDTVGTVKSAGLPNITGMFQAHTASLCAYIHAYMEGAFQNDGNPFPCDGNVSKGEWIDRTRFVYFDASKSNSIYGNSNTVQPPTLTMRYIIKY